MRSTASTTHLLAPATLVLLLVVLAEPATAAARTPVAQLPIPNPINVVGSGLDAIGGAASGLLDFGVDELGKLVFNLISGILDKLIPDSIEKKGADVLIWSVSVENWGRRGGRAYPAINQLQSTLTWIGVALMTTGGAWSGLRVVAGLEAVEDALRGWVTAIGGLALFSWGFTQAAALTNSTTDLVLHQPQVFKGLNLLAGVVLGGAAAAGLATGGLVLPLVLIAAALLFVGLLAAKTMLLLLGALVFVTGPLVFALRVWPFGPMVLRAWWSLAAAVFGIPIVWTLIFAVGGVLIKDGFGSGVDAGFELDAGKTLNALMVSIAGVATIYMALKAAKTIAGMAQAAPLAMLSSVGTGAGTAATAGGGRSSRASTATVGEAAGNLRSQSARQMNTATPGTPNVSPAMSAHNAKAQGVQLAATSMAGPVAGQIAGAVYTKIAQPNDQGPSEPASPDTQTVAAPPTPTGSTSSPSLPTSPDQPGSLPATPNGQPPAAAGNAADTTGTGTTPPTSHAAPGDGGGSPEAHAAVPATEPAASRNGIAQAPHPQSPAPQSPAPHQQPAPTPPPQPQSAAPGTQSAAPPPAARNGNAAATTSGDSSPTATPTAPPAAARTLAGLQHDPASATRAFGEQPNAETPGADRRSTRPTPKTAKRTTPSRRKT